MDFKRRQKFLSKNSKMGDIVIIDESKNKEIYRIAERQDNSDVWNSWWWEESEIAEAFQNGLKFDRLLNETEVQKIKSQIP